MTGGCVTMWKAPSRPNNNITQTYNSGRAVIYAVVDVAEPGHAPVESLMKKAAVPFDEQRVGINRFYSAMQNQIRIDRVIRISAALQVDTQDVAEIGGRKYRIDQVQTVDGIYPPSVDLSLTRYTQGVRP